jgi:hypothetical protein
MLLKGLPFTTTKLKTAFLLNFLDKILINFNFSDKIFKKYSWSLLYF